MTEIETLDSPKPMYEVIVGNVGCVYRGECPLKADVAFHSYVKISRAGIGRAGNETVTKLRNGNVIQEHESPSME